MQKSNSDHRGWRLPGRGVLAGSANGASALILALLALAIAPASPLADPAATGDAAPVPAVDGTDGPAGDGIHTFSPQLANTDFDARDRLAILNLLQSYSHLADGLHTQAFGDLFSDDAVFVIHPYPLEATAKQPTTQADDAAPAIPIRMQGRAAIVASLRPRHAEFRRQRVQRRHFLTNPVVWDQQDRSARVAVYLQLRTSTAGGPSKLVATGRYEGRVLETPEGWRIAEWTLHSDQVID